MGNKRLIKLLPFIMPKVQTVSYKDDAPLLWTKLLKHTSL